MSTKNILSTTIVANRLQSLKGKYPLEAFSQLEKIVAKSGGLPYHITLDGLGEGTIRSLFKDLGLEKPKATVNICAPYGSSSSIRSVTLQRTG